MPNEIQDLRAVDADTHDYILEENVTVPLKSSDGLVRLNIYRPRAEQKAPVLATYGPYGKDIPYQEYEHPTTPPSHHINHHLQLPPQVIFRGQP